MSGVLLICLFAAGTGNADDVTFPSFPGMLEFEFAEPEQPSPLDYGAATNAGHSPGVVTTTMGPSPTLHLQRQRPWLLLESQLTNELLDFQNSQTNKERLVLRHAGRPVGHAPSVVVGGQARLSALAAATNSEDKFPYLGRFPTDFTGDTASDARVLQANMHATARVTPFATMYGELLFSDVFTFGDFRQGSLQVRQAYAVLGDLRVSPFYAYLGKKNIGFGDLETLSPFTQSVVWHYFAALGEGVGVGYHDSRWDMTLAAINGGRGIRVNDSPDQGKLNNLATNITFKLGDSPDARFRIGGGFLLGTIYDGFTAEHLDRSQYGNDYNSAWNLYSRLDLGRTTLSGEWISTTHTWPVTGSLVSAYRTEAAWWFDRGPQASFFSVSWSAGDQGPDGTEFEFNRQLVVGYQKQLSVNLRLSAEYVRSMGFAPLIDITTASDRDVAQDSIVLGATLVL